MKLSEAERAKLRPVLEDPVAFSKGVLGGRPWRLQREIMRSVASHSLTTVKACHASGKTRCAAEIVLWFLARYLESIVVTTAPTFRQVKLLWAEIAEAAKRSKLRYPEATETKMAFPDNEKHYGIGLSTNDASKFQGFHAEHVLIIVDEATGVAGQIFDAIEGVRAGGDVRVLLLGNPTVPAGKFFDSHTRDREIWNTFTISAFDTPNFAGIDQAALAALPIESDELTVGPTPYLVGRKWVRERLAKWGPSNPLYMSRVLGQFPSQSAYSVFSLEWIERAKRDIPPFPADGVKRVIQVGIDVAGPGEDETVLYARVGGVVIDFEAWSQPDPRGEIIAKLTKLRHYPGCVLGPVVVDIVGIGWYLARHLIDHRFDVYGYNAGGRANNPEQFVNSKAETYWGLREWMERDAIAGVADEETQAQLSGVLYGHTPAGLVYIESKDDARKRGQSSPDRAEALVLAFAPVGQGDRQIDVTAPAHSSMI